jgi:hypothetical protein
MKELELSVLHDRFAVCRLGPNEVIPEWVFSARFWSMTRTDGELSLILPEESVPSNWKADRGWRCLKVLGPIDLSLPGVLASLSMPLARAKVSIFAISTYDTDYLLVRSVDFEKATEVLVEHGHRISP